MAAFRWSDPRWRLAALGAAIAVVIGTILLLLFTGKKTEEDEVRTILKNVIRQFETHQADSLPQYFDDSTALYIGDSEVRLDALGIVATARAVCDEHPMIRIRPQATEVWIAQDHRRARVHMSFQWTVTSTTYPNVRMKSEDLTAGGQPARALIRFVRGDGGWKIVQTVLELPK